MTTPDFEVLDSGARHEYDNGFVRDTEDGKYDYARLLSIPGLHLVPLDMLERFCAHMVKGAAKYGEDNWTKARGAVALGRFARSLVRHVVALITGKLDEDHAAAVWFNTAAYARVQQHERDAAERLAAEPGRKIRKRRRERLERLEGPFVESSETVATAGKPFLLPKTAPGPAQGVATTCRHGEARRANGSKHARTCVHWNPDHAGGCLDQHSVRGEPGHPLSECGGWCGDEHREAEALVEARRAGPVDAAVAAALSGAQREAALSVGTTPEWDVPANCDNPDWHTRKGCRCFGG